MQFIVDSKLQCLKQWSGEPILQQLTFWFRSFSHSWVFYIPEVGFSRHVLFFSDYHVFFFVLHKQPWLVVVFLQRHCDIHSQTNHWEIKLIGHTMNVCYHVREWQKLKKTNKKFKKLLSRPNPAPLIILKEAPFTFITRCKNRNTHGLHQGGFFFLQNILCDLYFVLLKKLLPIQVSIFFTVPNTLSFVIFFLQIFASL